MVKTIEQMHNEKQSRIEKAIQKKEFHQSKTEMSIGFRWAVNVAIAFLPENLRGTEEGFKEVKKWLEEFMILDRTYMIENMPQEKPDYRQRYAQAKKEAPRNQAMQNKADELGQETLPPNPEDNLPTIEQ